MGIRNEDNEIEVQAARENKARDPRNPGGQIGSPHPIFRTLSSRAACAHVHAHHATCARQPRQDHLARTGIHLGQKIEHFLHTFPQFSKTVDNLVVPCKG